VTSVDLGARRIMKHVSLQTKGQTYHIEVNQPSKDELKEGLSFVREKVDEANQPQQVQTDNGLDPTEQLQNIKNLHDEGVLTDDEFEEKKQSLLDKI
jgi:hypothetical protein